jgi:hypothetical protein
MALPDLKRSLIRVATVPIEPGTKVNFYKFATKSSVATVIADGYFNFARDYLKKNDVIDCMCAADSTGDMVTVRLASVPSSGDVTVAMSSGVEALTDNSGGTASDTVAAISDTATKNAVASIVAQLNKLAS